MTETATVHWGDSHKPPPSTATHKPYYLAFFQREGPHVEVWSYLHGTHYPGLIAVVGPFPGNPDHG